MSPEEYKREKQAIIDKSKEDRRNIVLRVRAEKIRLSQLSKEEKQLIRDKEREDKKVLLVQYKTDKMKK